MVVCISKKSFVFIKNRQPGRNTWLLKMLFLEAVLQECDIIISE